MAGKMKKIVYMFSLVLAAALLLVCIPVAFAQQGTSQAEAIIASASGRTGDIIEVAVEVKNCPEISGLDIRVYNDPSMLEYQGYTAGDALKGVFVVSNYKDNEFIYVGASTAFKPSGTWFTLKYKVISDKAETTALTFSRLNINDDYNKYIDCKAVNGVISINGGNTVDITTPVTKQGDTETTTAGTDSTQQSETTAVTTESSGQTAAETYKVVADASTGGTVDPAVMIVEEGQIVTLTFTPDSGYKFSRLLINGEEVVTTSETNYTLTGINCDYDIFAVFLPDNAYDQYDSSTTNSEKQTDSEIAPVRLDTKEKGLIIALVAATFAAGIIITVINVRKERRYDEEEFTDGEENEIAAEDETASESVTESEAVSEPAAENTEESDDQNQEKTE